MLIRTTGHRFGQKLPKGNGGFPSRRFRVMRIKVSSPWVRVAPIEKCSIATSQTIKPPLFEATFPLWPSLTLQGACFWLSQQNWTAGAIHRFVLPVAAINSHGWRLRLVRHCHALLDPTRFTLNISSTSGIKKAALMRILLATSHFWDCSLINTFHATYQKTKIHIKTASNIARQSNISYCNYINEPQRMSTHFYVTAWLCPQRQTIHALYADHWNRFQPRLPSSKAIPSAAQLSVPCLINHYPQRQNAGLESDPLQQ